MKSCGKEDSIAIKDSIQIVLKTPNKETGEYEIKVAYVDDGRKAVYKDGNGNKKELEFAVKSASDDTEALLHKLTMKMRAVSAELPISPDDIS